MAARLEKDKEFHISMMLEGSMEDKEATFKYLLTSVKGPEGNAPVKWEHWMRMPECGHLLADTWNCVVHFFWKGLSIAFAPKHAVCLEQLKHRRIVMALVDKNHFIGLQLNKECPLPPLCMFSFWEKFRNKKSKEWMKLYEDNMDLWNVLDESKECHIDLTKGGLIDLNEIPPIYLSDD
ncbi:uncharacterized protein LOC113291314 [Papaver somniferum]|uniref:uncharacterized protein LOC113291314 n=1 Tax=Papaver somniferum TaxID=3469 RepID=UPI000E6FA330|nr:uncharacterized protein LOC113291314 [Papaver somniferum]